MGACGSSSAACRKDRSASVAQKECICATPCSKNCWACGFWVVMGKRTTPCPGRSLAGSDGGTLPAAGTQRSGDLLCPVGGPSELIWAKPLDAKSTKIKKCRVIGLPPIAGRPNQPAVGLHKPVHLLGRPACHRAQSRKSKKCEQEIRPRTSRLTQSGRPLP